ncbi:MAG: phage portal protein [Pseudomonadota bacterium]
MKFNWLNRTPDAAPEGKAVSNRPVIAFHGAGRAVWSPRDSGSLTRSGFLGNPVGFRCVKLIAEAGASVPFVLQGVEERYAVHPILELLKRPNPGQGRSELLEALIGQILLTGDGFVEAVGAEAPRELHVLRSDRVRIVPGSSGWPVAYEYGVSGRTQRIGLSDVCHIRAFHPQDDHYGLSPLQAAAQAVDVHNAAAKWSKALLDNAARPSGAIVYRGIDGSGAMTPDQFDRLRGELEGHHQGAANAGRPMLLEGGLDWKPMGFSPSDMEFQKTKEAAARDIALAFGVPPMLLGLPGDNTYANYQEANRAFYRHTVLPLMGKISAALGSWLGEAAELMPDLDQIPALATERESQWKRIASADFLDADEKRAMLGLPPRGEP